MKKLIYISVFITSLLKAQENFSIKSLEKDLKRNISDTTRVKVLCELSNKLRDKGDTKEAFYLAKQAETLIPKLGNSEFLWRVYNQLAVCYTSLSDYSNSIKNHTKALQIATKIKNKNLIATSFNNIGIVYYNIADFPKAINCFQKSLRAQEELGNNLAIASAIGNIAVVYGNLNEDSLSLIYQLKSYKMHEQMNNKSEMMRALNNLGSLYRKKKLFNKANTYYEKSLTLATELDEKLGIVNGYSNIGSIYYETNKFTEALEMFLKSKKLLADIDDKKTLATLNIQIAETYKRLGKHEESILYFKTAYELAKNIGSLVEQRDAANNLYISFKDNGDFKASLLYHEIARKLNDSIFSKVKNESLNKLKMQFVLDRQERDLKSQAEVEIKKQKDEKAQQRIVLYSSFFVLLLVLIFSVVLWQRFTLIKKQNKIIESQKILVEGKNKEITDSILYAKRLQHTIIPSLDFFEKLFFESFVFFKPKDIVSGDFYWATRTQDFFYLAVCDCTGHGVPGAFMSLLNISFLNEAINEKNIAAPNEVLNYVRQRLIENMDGGHDGMDAILLKIPIASIIGEIEYSAANNAPVLIRNKTIFELPKDKMPVGRGENLISFKLQTVRLEKGDVLYLYTDGYADQFGGPNGKKFKYKQLEDLFLSIHEKSVEEQKNILIKVFEDWKGKLEQVDDICVVGIRV